MSAIRAARGFTKRDKIVKFEGCYHGHSDGLLVKGGSGLLTNSIPNSAGVPKATQTQLSLQSITMKNPCNSFLITAVMKLPV